MVAGAIGGDGAVSPLSSQLGERACLALNPVRDPRLRTIIRFILQL